MNVKKWFRQATSNRVLAVGLLLIHAAIYYRAAFAFHEAWRYALVAAALVAIAGLVRHRPWGIKWGSAMLLVFCIGKVLLVITQGFSWRLGIQIFALGWMAWCLWRKSEGGLLDDEVEKPEPNEDNDEEPLISLVQLRARIRYLEAPVLANALSEAWDLTIAGGDDVPDDAHGFVSGNENMFIVMLSKPKSRFFIVHNREGNYFDDAEALEKKVPNMRFGEIIRTHEAWLAMDVIGPRDDDSFDPAEAYQMIGKAASVLADDDTLAIFCPQHSYFNLWSPELEHALCGDSPLDIFHQEVKAPVIRVDDESGIAAAMAEARRRWPEFVAAFKSRKSGDDRYIIKAAFTSDEGKTEYMWLTVYGLEPEYVHGHLINEPLHCKDLQRGSLIEVPVERLSDWLCPDADDRPLGNFTDKIVHSSSKGKDEG